MADHRLLHVSEGIVRSFAGPIRLGAGCPCGVTFMANARDSVGHVPGWWRKLVAFTHVDRLPLMMSLVTGLESLALAYPELAIPRGCRMNSH